MLSLIPLLLLSILSNIGYSQNQERSGPGHFLSPPDAGQELFFGENVVLTVGDIFQARWTTTLSQYSIYLWQQSIGISSGVLGSSIHTKILGGPTEGSFNWTVDAQAFDISQSNVFFLALGPTSDINQNTVTSHYFNLTKRSVTSSSSSTTATTITASSASTASNTIYTTTGSVRSTTTGTIPNAAADGSTSSAPVVSTQSSSNNSSAMQIGIGVGVAAGVLILIIAAGAFFLYRRKQKKRRSVVSPPGTSYPIVVNMDKDRPMPPQKVPIYDQAYHTMPPRYDRWNDGHNVLAELPSDNAVRR